MIFYIMFIIIFLKYLNFLKRYVFEMSSLCSFNSLGELDIPWMI